jgi:hypothetical protein
MCARSSARAGANGAFVTGIGAGAMLRVDVEAWLEERDKAVKERRPWLAKMTAWIAVVAVIVAAAIAVLLSKAPA